MYYDIKELIDKLLDIIINELKSEGIISDESIDWQDIQYNAWIRYHVEKTVIDLDALVDDIADIAAKEVINDSILLIENTIDGIIDDIRNLC